MLETNTIMPGVYVDGVDVGGLTKAQAIAAVNAVHPEQQTAFDITVTIGSAVWHVTQDNVAITRDTADVIDRAWWYGRSNTT